MTEIRNYFLGSATLDLTQSNMDIFFQWRVDAMVFIIFTPSGPTPLPDTTALNVIFLSSSPTGVPAGIAATNIVFGSLIPLAGADDIL